jgi:hypothetical protein
MRRPQLRTTAEVAVLDGRANCIIKVDSTTADARFAL